MRFAKKLGIGLLLGITLGCSPRDFLTRRLAADLIATSDPFRAPQVFWLKTGVVSANDFNAAESLVLQRKGWIVGTPAPCPPGLEPAPCWDIVLSPAGVETIRPLVANPVPPSGLTSIRVARRDVADITGISKAGNFADVEFTWQWVPLNDLGTALYEGSGRYRTIVAFRKFDDGWRVVNESMRSNQSMEEAMKNSQNVR